MIGVVTGLTLLLSGAMMLRNRPPPRDPATVLYRRFVRRLGITPGDGETPDAFAVRAAAVDGVDEEAVLRVTRAYLAVRYGGSGDTALAELASAVSAAR